MDSSLCARSVPGLDAASSSFPALARFLSGVLLEVRPSKTPIVKPSRKMRWGEYKFMRLHRVPEGQIGGEALGLSVCRRATPSAVRSAFARDPLQADQDRILTSCTASLPKLGSFVKQRSGPCAAIAAVLRPHASTATTPSAVWLWVAIPVVFASTRSCIELSLRRPG